MQMFSYLVALYHSDVDERDGVLNHRVSIVCLAVCSGVDQRKHQISVSLAFVRVTSGIPLTNGQ